MCEMKSTYVQAERNGMDHNYVGKKWKICACVCVVSGVWNICSGWFLCAFYHSKKPWHWSASRSRWPRPVQSILCSQTKRTRIVNVSKVARFRKTRLGENRLGTCFGGVCACGFSCGSNSIGIYQRDFTFFGCWESDFATISVTWTPFQESSEIFACIIEV